METDIQGCPDRVAAIAESVRNAIGAGEFGVGDRHPGEHTLARVFDVSRPTIREALTSLRANGWIETRRGVKGGAFVRLATSKETLNNFPAFLL